MFTRPHHQRIAKVLESLDTDLRMLARLRMCLEGQVFESADNGMLWVGRCEFFDAVKKKI